jgi:hypothetical protein
LLFVSQDYWCGGGSLGHSLLPKSRSMHNGNHRETLQARSKLYDEFSGAGRRIYLVTTNEYSSLKLRVPSAATPVRFI